VNQVLEDMLRMCILDFGGSWVKHIPLVEFAYNNSYQASIGMAPFEALYGRPCRTPLCWSETGDSALHTTDVVRETTEKVAMIIERLKTAQSRQVSYADPKRRDVEFQVGDFVFLKVSPIRGVRRFGKKGKLAPRYVGPFSVESRVGKVAYELRLPQHMAGVHPVFHVSMLRKHVPDGRQVVEPDVTGVTVRPDASVEVEPVRLLARSERKLRTKVLPLVKVLWSTTDESDATWELEEDVRRDYPHLFENEVFSIPV
jgi:hypothetical protein